MFERLLSVAVALLVLGCGGDGGGGIVPPDPVDVQGTWSGTFPADSGAQEVSLELQLTEASGVVTGTGTLVSTTGTFPLTVNGVYDSPRLSIALATADFAPVSLVALVSETSMTGTVGGGGFRNETFTLNKQ